MGERIGEMAGRQTVGLKAGWHVDIHTGTWTLDQAGYLVGNHMERRVERRASGSAVKQKQELEQFRWTP